MVKWNSPYAFSNEFFSFLGIYALIQGEMCIHRDHIEYFIFPTNSICCYIPSLSAFMLSQLYHIEIYRFCIKIDKKRKKNKFIISLNVLHFTLSSSFSIFPILCFKCFMMCPHMFKIFLLYGLDMFETLSVAVALVEEYDFCFWKNHVCELSKHSQWFKYECSKIIQRLLPSFSSRSLSPCLHIPLSLSFSLYFMGHNECTMYIIWNIQLLKISWKPSNLCNITEMLRRRETKREWKNRENSTYMCKLHLHHNQNFFGLMVIRIYPN